MKTKLSLITLFACAVAGTTLLADNENYDGGNLSGRDFSYDSLKNSSWFQANLTDADLCYATLTDADFTEATLTRVSIYGVSAQNVNFTDADLSGADFYYYYDDDSASDLSGAKFIRANLTSADLRYATLTGADFTDSVIVGADFSFSGLTLSQLYSTKSYKDKNLSGVVLNRFDLSGESFSGFNLTSADLRYATLTDADFTGANLTSANLHDATLTDADFTDSVIVGADFSFSGLTLSQLYSTKSYKDKNLSGVVLNRFDLSGSSFSGFNLTGASLDGRTLTGADFTGANLTSADSAQNVNFTDADLSGADFYYSYYDDSSSVSDLSGAKFIRANLTSADLRYATLTDADFTGANLTSTDLSFATLTGADFTEATLTGVSICGVSVQNVNFTDADLSGADFYYSYYDDSYVSGANLTSAYLSFATLTGADFTEATLTGVSICGVSGADFSFSGLILSQLYSTKSYKDKNLSRVGLKSFDLSGESFSGFNLTSADLSYATLTDADFTGATLTRVSIYGVSAQNVNFTDADLSGAFFYYYDDDSASDLSGAKFIRANLRSADLRHATLTDADFTGANLTSADLRYATLTDADFTDSVIVGADFSSSGLTLSQLYSTKSYKDKNLSRVDLGSLDLSGSSFLGFNLTSADLCYATLTDADFTGANLTSADLRYATLTDADFTEATLTRVSIYGASAQNVNFTDADLNDANFYYDSSSASDLSGAKFIRANLTSADLCYATLTDADFTGANLTSADLCYATLTDADFTHSVIVGADFFSSGLTLSQLYSTKSYRDKDLSGVNFGSLDLSGANFKKQNLIGSSWEHATLTKADFRRATSLSLTWNTTTQAFSKTVYGSNVILADGTIGAFDVSAGTTFRITGDEVSAKLRDQRIASGMLVLEEGATLDVCADATLHFEKGEAHFMASGASNGLIFVKSGGSVTLASGAKIVIDYAGTFDENTRFAVMNWTDSSSIVGLNSLTKGGTLSLFVDGAVYDDTLWDFSTENNALTIFSVATSVDPDPDLPDPDEPIIPDPDVPVIPEAPARVVISSASQSVDLTETDSSADFDGSLTVFSGTVSGAGSLNSAGTLTFSGDASTHTGTTNITSGTFTVSGSAKLGTGDFDISGTLAIYGSRTFSNATRGTGTLRIASGTTTFTNDVGVKTFAVSQGASVTLSAGVDLTRADAEAQVAGTLNLLGTRTFSAKTSGNGKISLASGSDVSFAKAVGVKTLAVENGATLRGSVSMTHGADAKISLAGTLVLNPDKGEKVSLGGGRVEIASSAKLDLVGSNSPFVRATSAQIEALENGERVTIFEGGAVSGNVPAFLRTDADLSAYAQNYAVIYDESNGGLSVRVVKNASVLMDGTDTSELSASFVDWALSDANDALNSLSTGFVSAAAWNNLSGGNDPLLNAILAKDAGTARAILDRLSPKSYAAMIAMTVEAFNADARSIFARLEQRRYDRFSKRAQWEFFAQLQTNSVENDTATDAPTFDFDTTGLLAGADYKLDQNTVLGVALGASTGEAKVHNGGGKIESTDFRITGFVGKTIENYFVNAGAQLGYASYDIKRNTDYGNASGDTTGWSAGLFADAGTVVTLSEAKKIYATPYIGLAYMHTQADAFAESGSDKAFDADAISGDSLRARVGCGFSWGFTASGAIWRLGLDVAFSHDFLGDEVDVDVTTQDDSSITETAKALPEDMFSIGPSFNVDVSSSASVYGGYSFNAGTDASVNHSANVGFRMRF